jgi:hypothetical protein
MLLLLSLDQGQDSQVLELGILLHMLVEKTLFKMLLEYQEQQKKQLNSYLKLMML